MVKIDCEKCRYKWDYKGKSVYYVTCPRCYNKIRKIPLVDKFIKPKPNNTSAKNNSAYTVIVHEFFKNKCQDCGRSSKIRLNLHHINGDDTCDELKNLTLLCSKCHSNAHKKLSAE